MDGRKNAYIGRKLGGLRNRYRMFWGSVRIRISDVNDADAKFVARVERQMGVA